MVAYLENRSLLAANVHAAQELLDRAVFYEAEARQAYIDCLNYLKRTDKCRARENASVSGCASSDASPALIRWQMAMTRADEIEVVPPQP
jgi:hypothetical protein